MALVAFAIGIVLALVIGFALSRTRKGSEGHQDD